MPLASHSGVFRELVFHPSAQPKTFIFWHYIRESRRSKLNHSQKIITECNGININCDSSVYYKVRRTVITNCDSFFITKCDTVYYKLRQVLQSAINLLQISTGITKCDDYHKLRQYPAICSISSIFHRHFTFSHPPNFVLLCSNIYLSLPSYILTNRKFAKWTFRSKPELLINVMVL